MSTFDLILLLFLMASAMFGFWRGLVQTGLALATWVVASLVTYRYTYSLETMLEPRLPDQGVRIILSAVLLFLMAMFAGKAVQYLASRFIKAARLTVADRLLGGIFGALRGLVLITIFMLVVEASPMFDDSWWKNSTWIQQLKPFVRSLISGLPEELRYFYRAVQ